MNIAILGATGHIAKSLIYSYKDEPNINLFLFSRTIEKVISFTNEISVKNCVIKSYEHFNDFQYTSVINCTGIGNQAVLESKPYEVFFVTEEIDLLIIKYLNNHPQTTYVNFSSGAVHGTAFNKSVQDDARTCIDVNNLTVSDYYGIAKINAEAKHRSMQDFNIVDLRIFGFYSRFIEHDRPYLLSEILNAIKSKEVFVTSRSNIIRDYIHPNDLAALVKKCMGYEKINTAFDVCSKEPIAKFDILDYFKSSYALKYEVDQNSNISSITGTKVNYFSESKKMREIGFKPYYTALECIEDVTRDILQPKYK